MRRRRGGGLVGCGRAAPAGVEVVLAGARAAPSTATRPGGRRRRVRVRVREAGSAVAIELQGGRGGRGPRSGGPGQAGGAEQAESAPRRGRTAAGASGAAARAAGAAGLRCRCRPPARARVASEARQPRALRYWALMPGSRARRLGLAPPPLRVAGPRPAPALHRPPGLSRRAPARQQYNRRRPG